MKFWSNKFFPSINYVQGRKQKFDFLSFSFAFHLLPPTSSLLALNPNPRKFSCTLKAAHAHISLSLFLTFLSLTYVLSLSLSNLRSLSLSLSSPFSLSCTPPPSTTATTSASVALLLLPATFHMRSHPPSFSFGVCMARVHGTLIHAFSFLIFLINLYLV